MDGNLYIQTTVFIYSTPAVAGNRCRARNHHRLGQVALTHAGGGDFSGPRAAIAFAI
jgi:hypothetical protein